MVVDPAIPAEHRALLEKHLAPFPHKVQVAIALVKDGSTVFLGAERTPEGLRKVDNRTGVFEIGSITKVFTATLFAQEVTKGNLKMDDPVQPFLPFRLNVSGRDGTEMTLKHLASHTAGFKHHQPPGLSRHAFFHAHRDDPYRCFDEARFEAYLRKDLELVSRPGAEYHYSNLGMSLLAKILMLRSGKSYETLLQERIFGPLGMSSSTTEIAKVRARVVQGVRGRGEAAPTTNMNALAPSGGILTCAEDMARFARTQFAPADSALALTQQPVFTIEPGYSVALGWHLVDRTNGERWINHNGGMEGYTASVNVNPRKRCAVIVLCNYRNDDERGEEIRSLCRELLKGLEAQPEKTGLGPQTSGRTETRL
jgi:CubicO group peptidase (beta-lactamase class C family)